MVVKTETDSRQRYSGFCCGPTNSCCCGSTLQNGCLTLFVLVLINVISYIICAAVYTPTFGGLTVESVILAVIYFLLYKGTSVRAAHVCRIVHAVLTWLTLVLAVILLIALPIVWSSYTAQLSSDDYDTLHSTFWVLYGEIVVISIIGVSLLFYFDYIVWSRHLEIKKNLESQETPAGGDALV